MSLSKYVRVKGRYHKQLRALSYKYDIPIEEVIDIIIDIILENALKDESKFDELFQKRRKKSD